MTSLSPSWQKMHFLLLVPEKGYFLQGGTPAFPAGDRRACLSRTPSSCPSITRGDKPGRNACPREAGSLLLLPRLCRRGCRPGYGSDAEADEDHVVDLLHLPFPLFERLV